MLYKFFSFLICSRAR